MMDQEIKWISINVNGLNSPIKRNRIFNKLKRLQLDIICLQEVHIKKQHVKVLENRHFGQLYTSLIDQAKRGVALFVNNKIESKLVFSDDEGRILMVEIQINFQKILLIVIYAPNDNQDYFYLNLHKKINEISYENICLLGDFNGVVKPELDYKSPIRKGAKRKALPKNFFDLIEEWGMIDIWRERNFEKRQFTFYSARHTSFSRIDMIWLSGNLRDQIKKIDIDQNVWADHNPLVMSWQGKKRKFRWNLRREILKEVEFQKYVKTEMAFFFKENRREHTSLQNLWDTSKAYFRGLVSLYTYKKNKIKNICKKELEKKHKDLEQQLQATPDDLIIAKNLDLTKHKLNLLEDEEVVTKMKIAKQNFFEQANKPGKWLAYKIRKDREQKCIKQLYDGNDVLCHKEEEKRHIVWSYYNDLYRQEIIDDTKICRYLEEMKLPKISERYQESLDTKISMTELLEAIKKQKNDKAPGPDGLPAEFYKAFEDIFAPLMLDIFNEVMTEAIIPDSWTEAFISLIPKEGFDNTQVKNYRPISLLNVDYKIFASIIANRLKIYLNEFIHSDQNGFLPKRQIKDNMRIILDVIEFYEQHPEKQMALIFLDAQKAFDNVNWQFLHRQLQYMNFGTRFLHVIEAIYKKQTARILINGELTNKVEITKGTRQGCPLSPLLFILTLEVLNRNIRANDQIEGLKIRDQEFKLQAFADDLVFILEKPLTSGPELLIQIQKYGEVAGLKINKDKTKMIVKNFTEKQKEQLESKLDIQIVKNIKYLGIYISARCSSLKEDNYIKLKKQIEKDLEKWRILQLSLMGRIALIKMNVLPRLLFLFSTIPIKIDKSFFNDFNKKITKFIWQGKRPRISLKNLQDIKERGGFALPNWELYYHAAAMTWIKEWIFLRNRRLLTLEGHDLQMGWHAFMWYEKKNIHGYFQRHIIRNSLLEIWEKIKKKSYLKIPYWVSTIEAFTYPKRLDWSKILRYKDIVNQTMKLKSLKEFEELNLKIDWFRYQQLQSRFQQDIKAAGINFQKSELDILLFGKEENLIGKIYKHLLCIDLEFDQVKDTMIKWMRNFGYSIEIDDWQQLWERNYQMSISTAFKENIYKMFYRWHLAPEILAKMFKNLTAKCWKCNEKGGSFYHMWWTCTEARNYWQHIHYWIQKILKKNLDFKPEIYLLGIIPDNFTKDEIYLIIHILTAARIVYAQNWKLSRIPTEREILKKVMDCAEMCRLTLKFRDKQDSDYYKIWDKFYIWIENRS